MDAFLYQGAPWILEIENATQCDEGGVFGLFAQVSRAFADLCTHELSKVVTVFAFPEVSTRPNGGPWSWACQASLCNIPDLTGAPAALVTSQRPSGPGAGRGGAGAWRGRGGACRGRSPGPAWSTLCSAPVQGRLREGNGRPEFAKGSLKFSLESVFRIFAKTQATRRAPCEAVGV